MALLLSGSIPSPTTETKLRGRRVKATSKEAPSCQLGAFIWSG